MVEKPSAYDLVAVHRLCNRPDLPQILMEWELEELREKVRKLEAKAKTHKKPRNKRKP